MIFYYKSKNDLKYKFNQTPLDDSLISTSTIKLNSFKISKN